MGVGLGVGVGVVVGGWLYGWAGCVVVWVGSKLNVISLTDKLFVCLFCVCEMFYAIYILI